MSQPRPPAARRLKSRQQRRKVTRRGLSIVAAGRLRVVGCPLGAVALAATHWKCLFLLIFSITLCCAPTVLCQTADESTPPGGSTPDSGSTPGAQSGAEEPGGHYSIVSPNGVIYDGERGLALAQGDVTFTYREFVVHADRGIVDYNTNQAILSGHLTVTVRGQKFTGKSLTFDLDSGRWSLNQIEAVFPPEFFPTGTVIEPIYVQGASVKGTDDAVGSYDTVTGSDFRFSSCDRNHYYFRCKRIDFYRDTVGEPTRIVLHNNALYVMGRRMVNVPVYTISLTGATSRRIGLQPIVGQNETDGFFVKSVYNLGANAHHTDSLLIDGLQKRGLGLGFTRELAKGAGIFYLYGVTGNGSGNQGGREINSRIHYESNLFSSIRSIVDFQSTQNNQLGIENSNARNGTWSLSRHKPNVQSDFLMRFAANDSGLSSFRDFGTSLLHRQDFGGGLRLDASSFYTRNSFGAEFNTATLDNSVTLRKQARLFDTFLHAELHDDLTGLNQVNGAYQLERLPEFGFTTDTQRLGLPFLSQALPGDLSLNFGHYNEPFTAQRLGRADFIYAARPRDFQILRAGGLRSRLTTAGRFEQAFYSNDTARYNYEYVFNLNNTLGPLGAQINYYKRRSLGFTPFAFDYLTPGEYVDATLSFQPSDKYRLNVTTGRDLQNGFSRDIVASLQAAPSPSFYASLGVNYSPETRTFGDVIGNFRLARKPRRFLGGNFEMGVRYSVEENKFTQINTAADLFVSRKTRVQALSGYDGFARQFTFNQIRVTRDLHCFNLYATFDQQRKELRFDLALKAFPFVDTRFGRSEFGEGFAPFVGDVR
ncbi:MAG TPA: hypothetical protein VNA16_11480 [Abditibacteriaceae bacterium]|nr:hypothetical protein [Abditibacteriaceae bacterium]